MIKVQNKPLSSVQRAIDVRRRLTLSVQIVLGSPSDWPNSNLESKTNVKNFEFFFCQPEVYFIFGCVALFQAGDGFSCSWLCFWGGVQECAFCERKGIKTSCYYKQETRKTYFLMVLLVKSDHFNFWQKSRIIMKKHKR